LTPRPARGERRVYIGCEEPRIGAVVQIALELELSDRPALAELLRAGESREKIAEAGYGLV
jgi:hypothetical protein